MARKNVQDEEDEFDAMFEEEMNKEGQKEIGVREQVEEEDDEKKDELLESEEPVPGGKTLDQISEEVPQDIKDKIIDLEAEQQMKLRETMLQTTFQPKTSALKNLQEMFEDYPVITNESLKLKMETIGQIKTEVEDESTDQKEQLDPHQEVFSRLLNRSCGFGLLVSQMLL